MRVIIGMADMKVSKEVSDELVTFSLGSCIGLAIYDPVAHVGGILHYMLPDSHLAPEKAKANPYMFADTGIPLLFRESYRLGAVKQRIIVKAAGGAQILDPAGMFNIGQKNIMALRKILWQNEVILKAAEIGGNVNRTVFLEMATGNVTLKLSGSEMKKL